MSVQIDQKTRETIEQLSILEGIHPYRSDKEARYYGSDLNKFIHENCSKEMDVVNIDCFVYKASRRRFRIIESKHSKEDLSKRQKILLPMLSRFLRFVFYEEVYQMDIFTVWGDYPYDDVLIRDMLTGKEYIIQDQKLFIAWLEFTIKLDNSLEVKKKK